MSLGFYNSGLPFWNEQEIILREYIISSLSLYIKTLLLNINSAWNFYRFEGPILTPKKYIDLKNHDDNDLFIDKEEKLILRPETTMSSYVYSYSNKSIKKLPICFWQSGKSFRRETNDGARASKLRFNEFYQIEFQCIFSDGTKADYRELILNDLCNYIKSITNKKTFFEDSDRLPHYSNSTIDIISGDFEVASLSYRNDYNRKNTKVLELAFGLDRLVILKND